MKVTGIIAEFNPLHNGHSLLIEKAKQMGASHTVAVMSGSFVQRGEPAFFETKIRTEAALACGIDLVVQLPVTRACAGAEAFASGGVGILEASGIIDSILFGSECGNIDLLKETAELAACAAVKEKIPGYMDKGLSYASARENALGEFRPECAEIIKTPNNILATEYIKALNSYGSSITPETIRRIGPGHNSEKVEKNYAGASELRKLFRENAKWENLVPGACTGIYKKALSSNNSIVIIDKFSSLVLYKLRTSSPEEIALLPDISEGLENRICEAAKTVSSAEEFFSAVSTKRYTVSRIRRAASAALIGITAKDTAMPVPYIRLLGFNEKGRELIKEMKRSAALPVIDKPADFSSLDSNMQRVFNLECAAADIRSLCCGKVEFGSEKNKPVIL